MVPVPHHWLDRVRRDPVPWLLDPVNPSVRWLMLRDVFHKPSVELEVAQHQIVDWPPVSEWLSHWHEPHFWGRVNNPYYGGSVGNFGTLYFLAQLGTPLTPEIRQTCENFLDMGRYSERLFSPGEGPSAPWMCYTGMSLFLLRHFGYQNDPRFVATWQAMLQTVLQRSELLSCPVAGGGCPAGWVKLLSALLSVPEQERISQEQEALERLATLLLGYTYDFRNWDRDWLEWAFPRYYGSDMLELCHLLSQTSQREHPRFLEFVDLLVDAQTEEGVWHKRRNTPIFAMERIHRPSRWLTYEAVHTLMLLYGDPIYAA